MIVPLVPVAADVGWVDRLAVVPSGPMLTRVLPGAMPVPVTTLPMSVIWLSGGVIPVNAGVWFGPGPGTGAVTIAVSVPMPIAIPVAPGVVAPVANESVALVPPVPTCAIVVPAAMPGPEIRSPWSLADSAGLMLARDRSLWVSAVIVRVGSALAPALVRLAWGFIVQTSSLSLTSMVLPHSTSSPFLLIPLVTAGSYIPRTR